MDAIWVSFFLQGFGLPFTFYAIAQLLALTMLRAWLRLWALLPIPLMAATLMSAIRAYDLHSNLWPIWLIILSPVALLYLMALFLWQRGARRSPPADPMPGS